MKKVLPVFFRRYTPTSYDQPHVMQEADALAQFVVDASEAYQFQRQNLTALGYSNGANVALAALIRHPKAFGAAILWRPVMPLENLPEVNLEKMHILITSGLHDPFFPHGKSVFPYLNSMNANVQEELLSAGHDLTEKDLAITKHWLHEVEASNYLRLP